ncbi:unnamed protein product [marine sediment metagenome]|uniref:Uncharacterized protein n=1 Tax=marine sediment metagenome TaxID=412755 RepID=X1MUD7_9ZZZZ
MIDLSKLTQAIKAGDVPPPSYFRPGETIETPGLMERWQQQPPRPGDVILTGGLNGVGQLPTGFNGVGTLADLPAAFDSAPSVMPVSTITPTHADVVPGLLGIVNGVPISGPGVPEPPRVLVAKQWSIAVRSETYGTFRVFFFKLIDGRIMCYNPSTKSWKIWRPKKHIVISRDPRMSTIRKLERTYDKVIRKLARKSKALKLA